MIQNISHSLQVDRKIHCYVMNDLICKDTRKMSIDKNWMQKSRVSNEYEIGVS